jgi:hypothetical protein
VAGEPILDLVVEDIAHELLFTALVDRIGREEGVRPRVRPRSTRGGTPAVVRELTAIKRALQHPFGDPDLPDVLLVAKDTDCAGWATSQTFIRDVIGDDAVPYLIAATPDPEIERWLLLDRAAFVRVVGVDPGPAEHDCTQNRFKTQLRRAVLDGGHTPSFDGFEFAEEIVLEMDLYDAGKLDASFGGCCDQLRGTFQAIRHA